jgi:hypothetical protein
MFLWYPVMDLARAPRRTARKKGSGYENGTDETRDGMWLICLKVKLQEETFAPLSNAISDTRSCI